MCAYQVQYGTCVHCSTHYTSLCSSSPFASYSHSLIYLYIDAYTLCIFSICLDTISPCETSVAYIANCMDPDQTASVIKLV